MTFLILFGLVVWALCMYMYYEGKGDGIRAVRRIYEEDSK